MAPQLKYVQIAEQLKRRIENGDYNFCAMPGVPKLAAEIGVSYLTARQAVQKLITDGVLYRADNSRLEICNRPGSLRSAMKVAFIHPINVTSDSVWRNAICKTAGEFACSFREIVYCHDADPLLYEGLAGGFDLIFLQFDSADPLFLEKLRKLSDRLVTLFHDLTRYGIRCLDGLNPAAIDELIRYLYERGHRRIDCLNTQPASPTVDARIAQWRASLKKHGCTGRLHNDPVAPFVWSMPHAYDVLNGVIARGELDADCPRRVALLPRTRDPGTGGHFCGQLGGNRGGPHGHPLPDHGGYARSGSDDSSNLRPLSRKPPTTRPTALSKCRFGCDSSRRIRQRAFPSKQPLKIERQAICGRNSL